jgi:hypothetical protein
VTAPVADIGTTLHVWIAQQYHTLARPLPPIDVIVTMDITGQPRIIYAIVIVHLQAILMERISMLPSAIAIQPSYGTVLIALLVLIVPS